MAVAAEVDVALRVTAEDISAAAKREDADDEVTSVESSSCRCC